MPKRKSKRLAAKQQQRTGDGVNISDVLGLTSHRDRRETLTAATALQRAEAAAEQHGTVNRSFSNITTSQRRPARATSQGPSPHASRLAWTPEDDGTDADEEFGYDEEGNDDVLTEEEPEDVGCL